MDILLCCWCLVCNCHFSIPILQVSIPILHSKETKPQVRDIFESMEYGPAPESPSVANAWLDDHGRNFGHFINNQWVRPEGRKAYETHNPATGEKLASTVQGVCVCVWGGGWGWSQLD